jgi:hypothetical protein
MFVELNYLILFVNAAKLEQFLVDDELEGDQDWTSDINCFATI